MDPLQSWALIDKRSILGINLKLVPNIDPLVSKTSPACRGQPSTPENIENILIFFVFVVEGRAA